MFSRGGGRRIAAGVAGRWPRVPGARSDGRFSTGVNKELRRASTTSSDVPGSSSVVGSGTVATGELPAEPSAWLLCRRGWWLRAGYRWFLVLWALIVDAGAEGPRPAGAAFGALRGWPNWLSPMTIVAG